MALVESSLSEELQTAFKSPTSGDPDVDTNIAALQKTLADAMATAIYNFVTSAEVTVSVSTPAGAGSGTGTIS